MRNFFLPTLSGMKLVVYPSGISLYSVFCHQDTRGGGFSPPRGILGIDTRSSGDPQCVYSINKNLKPPKGLCKVTFLALLCRLVEVEYVDVGRFFMCVFISIRHRHVGGVRTKRSKFRVDSKKQQQSTQFISIHVWRNSDCQHKLLGMWPRSDDCLRSPENPTACKWTKKKITLFELVYSQSRNFFSCCTDYRGFYFIFGKVERVEFSKNID